MVHIHFRGLISIFFLSFWKTKTNSVRGFLWFRFNSGSLLQLLSLALYPIFFRMFLHYGFSSSCEDMGLGASFTLHLLVCRHLWWNFFRYILRKIYCIYPGHVYSTVLIPLSLLYRFSLLLQQNWYKICILRREVFSELLRLFQDFGLVFLERRQSYFSRWDANVGNWS